MREQLNATPYYEEEIDRHYSTKFHYQAGTGNQNLHNLSEKIWKSLGLEIQNNINGRSNNQTTLSGLDYLTLVVIQLFHNWDNDPRLALASPSSNNRTHYVLRLYQYIYVVPSITIKIFFLLKVIPCITGGWVCR